MRLIVYGAGAVGGVLGARLHLAGHDVRLVARGAHLDAIRKDGLRLESPEVSTVVQLPAVDSVGSLALDAATCVLVAVKSQQTADVMADLAAHADPDITVASVQNGVANERKMLRHFAHVLGVCVMLPATHLEPGVVTQHSAPVPGMLDLGRHPPGGDDRAEALADALRSGGFDSVVRPDVMAWKHRKLISNLGNAVQAACVPGEARDRLAALAREEGERVLTRAGIPVVTREQDAERRGDILSPGAIGGPGSTRGGGSTWQSLSRGTGSVETDYLNGEIVLRGRLHGLATPVNELLRRTTLELARAHAAPSTLDAASLLARLG